MSAASEAKVERQITLYLLRHGKTPGNALGRYIGGRTDEGLSPEGRAELCAFPKGPERIYVSPMKRARETAEILFQKELEAGMKLCPVEELREIDFGEFENKNYKELSHNSKYQAWIDSNGTMDFPAGEAQSHFQERTMRALDGIVKECREQGCTRAAIVAHGGTLMTVMSQLTGKNYFDFQVKNGEGYALTISLSEEKIHVVSYDSISCRISA